jgi:hypothetical protein
MNKPTAADTPTPAPLDAERARLRSAGYTDAEISHILTQREIGASPQQPAPGTAPTSGVLSSALNSLVAVASHSRGYIMATKADFATLFSAASPAARLKAGGSLVLKAVIVAILGYAALQEWNQHIISATQQAASDAYLKCKTQGGCPGITAGLEETPISPQEIERERARMAALYDTARQIALNSPVVKAPDGRMVHAIGVIPERDFKAINPREGQLPNTEPLPDGANEITNDVASLYMHAPGWWLPAEGSAQ